MPTIVVPEGTEHPLSDLQTLHPIPQNQMFGLREALMGFHRKHPEARLYDACQGDGGASLPGVPPEILEAACRLQRDRGTAYGKPHGVPAFWRSVVEDYWKLDSRYGGPQNVISALGGRDALLKAYAAMLHLGHGRTGDLIVLPRVPWVSYNWGPYLMGANVLLAPGEEKDAWALTPDSIRECSAFAASQGRRIAGVVVTSPDNPTGRVTSLVDQAAIAKAAIAEGIPFVLFDWIYHYVTDEEPYDLNDFFAMFPPDERERLIILDGVTKSLGGSNIRNAHLIASVKVVGFTKRRASHGVIPSFYGMAVAMAAYQMGYHRACRGILEPISKSRRYLKDFLVARGHKHIMGQGYYAFLEVGDCLDKADFQTSAELGLWLAEEHGIAIVPGSFFSRYADRWIRFSYALEPHTTKVVAEKLFQVLGDLEGR